ncbi:myb/SANT-like DNA-binding domain-containing protein 3 [Eupeodes corollae]|uniref:myb/SANT-like DNA-binding domain-containing protein 3 n=1 Tax=Eupeodes corollae TaxID=290404 RepID=UPI00248F9A1E|nr:myb/SANT-like DNA-binding domain-containing protein 3 [Eupeodes corollae]
MLKKRMRSSNFNGHEEDTLIKCILRHASVIENKRTDAYTLREKKRAWQEVGHEFNSLCTNESRNVQALKDKYTNLKTLLRKQLATDRTYRNSTGNIRDVPEWRPRSAVMAQLATFLSSPKPDASPPIGNDYDHFECNDSHDAILPSVESAYTIESDDGEKPLDSINLQTVEILPNNNNDDDDDEDDDDGDNKEAIFPLKITQTSSIKSFPKYSPTRIRKPNRLKQRRVMSNVSSSSQNNKVENSLQSLKKQMLQRTLEMREIEHQQRLDRQQREHEARMTLLEVQRMDIETRIQLRQLKIAKFANKNNTNNNNNNIKTEIDYE